MYNGYEGNMTILLENETELLRNDSLDKYISSYSGTDIVRDYLLTITQYPLLTPEEELELTRKYKETKDIEVKNKIKSSYQGTHNNC